MIQIDDQKDGIGEDLLEIVEGEVTEQPAFPDVEQRQVLEGQDDVPQDREDDDDHDDDDGRRDEEPAVAILPPTRQALVRPVPSLGRSGVWEGAMVVISSGCP